MIANRKKEVARWIIQFNARKIVYLDIPEQLMLYGVNATEFIKERFIDSPPKCENTATIDVTNNSQRVPTDAPESGAKQNSTDHSESEQVPQDLDQSSVSENDEGYKSGENNDETKNAEPNLQNTFESGTFAIKLDMNACKCQFEKID